MMPVVVRKRLPFGAAEAEAEEDEGSSSSSSEPEADVLDAVGMMMEDATEEKTWSQTVGRAEGGYNVSLLHLRAINNAGSEGPQRPGRVEGGGRTRERLVSLLADAAEIVLDPDGERAREVAFFDGMAFALPALTGQVGMCVERHNGWSGGSRG